MKRLGLLFRLSALLIYLLPVAAWTQGAIFGIGAGRYEPIPTPDPILPSPPTNFFCTVWPNVTSNLYIGDFALNIYNVSMNSTVSVQRWLDVNTNGIVDDGDLLLQNFNVTDVTGILLNLNGPTNPHPPADSDPAPASIQVSFNANDNGLFRNFVGQYIFVVQSDTNTATAVCTVTNSAQGQLYSGNVVCNGTNVPYAGVLLYYTCDGVEVGPMMGGLTDSNGFFAFQTPLFPTKLVAFKSGYVGVAGGIPAIPLIVVTNVSPIPLELTLLPAAANISGSISGMTNGSSNSPIIIFGNSSNGVSTVGFSDTNGNFNLPVTQAQWKIKAGGLMSANNLGLLSYRAGVDVDTTTNSGVTTNLTVLPSDSLIHGLVRDNNGNSVPGVFVSARDADGLFDTGTYTDANGNYFLGVSSSNVWNVFVADYEQALHWGDTNIFTRSGTITLLPGDSIEQDILGMAAPYQISGVVRDGNSNVISGAGVTATFRGATNFYTYSRSDYGYYALNVPAGDWDVSVVGDSNRADGLQYLGYLPVNDEPVKIVNANGGADFITPNPGFVELSGTILDPNNNPIPNLSVQGAINPGTSNLSTSLITTMSSQTDANGFYRFFVTSANWTLGPVCDELNAIGLDCSNQFAKGDTFAGTNISSINFNPPYFTQMPFFTNQAPLGNYVYFLQDSPDHCFGYYNLYSFPWVYHYDLGYEYFFDANNDAHGAYLYDLTSGHFWYTEPGMFPFLYDFDLNAWLYCYPNTSAPGTYYKNPRAFYNFSTKQNWYD